MIKLGSEVYILEEHSLRFADRWGVVVEIATDSELPIGVMFNGEKQIPYFFHEAELLTVEQYHYHIPNNSVWH